MNKQKFTNIVKDYHSISADDRNKLHDLVKSYPYSQIIHTLLAKANTDANTDIAKQTLAYAAMYSADRSVLKEIIATKQSVKQKSAPKEEPQRKDKPTSTMEAETEEVVAKSEPKKSNKITIDPSVFNSGAPTLSETILKDLDDLKKSKASYLEWLKLPDDGDDEPIETKKPAKKTSTAGKSRKTKTASTAKKKKEAKPSTSKTSKTKAKKATSKSENKSETSKSKSTGKSDTKKSEPGKAEKVDQTKIIEKFISQEPSITAKASRKSPENQEDLSEASTSFNEDLVSENLAKIMISQGKTDKAIDIYKKLIWKFPQKKSYFASQIEELKNK